MARDHLVDKLTQGPGRNDLLECIQQLLKQNQINPPIPTFGNGYRSFPVRITKVVIFETGEIDIEGRLDYRDAPEVSGSRAVQDKKVFIGRYDPQSRTAQVSKFLD